MDKISKNVPNSIQNFLGGKTLISSFLMFVSSSYNHYHYFGLVAGSINLLVATIQKIMEFIQPERFKIEHQATSKAFEALSSNIKHSQTHKSKHVIWSIQNEEYKKEAHNANYTKQCM